MLTSEQRIYMGFANGYLLKEAAPSGGGGQFMDPNSPAYQGMGASEETYRPVERGSFREYLQSIGQLPAAALETLEGAGKPMVDALIPDSTPGEMSPAKEQRYLKQRPAKKGGTLGFLANPDKPLSTDQPPARVTPTVKSQRANRPAPEMSLDEYETQDTALPLAALGAGAAGAAAAGAAGAPEMSLDEYEARDMALGGRPGAPPTGGSLVPHPTPTADSSLEHYRDYLTSGHLPTQSSKYDPAGRPDPAPATADTDIAVGGATRSELADTLRRYAPAAGVGAAGGAALGGGASVIADKLRGKSPSARKAIIMSLLGGGLGAAAGAGIKHYQDNKTAADGKPHPLSGANPPEFLTQLARGARGKKIPKTKKSDRVDYKAYPFKNKSIQQGRKSIPRQAVPTAKPNPGK
jgi:hypothetical protein